MKEKHKKQYSNSFHVRLYDVETVKSVDELYKTGDFDSVNDLLGKAIAIGLEKIYIDYGKRRRLAQAIPEAEVSESVRLDRIEHELSKVRILEEDMYILMNSIKALTASIYNVHRANVKGEALSAELLDNYGFMAVLPDAYREIENSLLARFNRRLGKKTEGKPQ